MARVNQSCLTADIWLRAECGNTIPDRSKGQPNQLRYAREWLRMAQTGSGWRGLYYTYSKKINALKVKGHYKLIFLLI